MTGTVQTTHFEDAEKRPWRIRLTVNSIRRVKEDAGIDLLQPVPAKGMSEDEVGEISDYDELPPLMRLQVDMNCFCEVLYHVVKPQCDANEVSKDDFLDSMDGGAIKRAKDIFWPLYSDFFLQAGQEVMAKLVDVAGEGYRKLLEGLELDSKSVLEQISKTTSEINEALAGKTSTKSQAS